jgi:hypothetical protein
MSLIVPSSQFNRDVVIHRVCYRVTKNDKPKKDTRHYQGKMVPTQRHLTTDGRPALRHTPLNYHGASSVAEAGAAVVRCERPALDASRRKARSRPVLFPSQSRHSLRSLSDRPGNDLCHCLREWRTRDDLPLSDLWLHAIPLRIQVTGASDQHPALRASPISQPAGQ